MNYELKTNRDEHEQGTSNKYLITCAWNTYNNKI